ncbi:transglutaminase-like cysteine peptidase [Rhizobiaceae bacterium n13]|uniref:Transglutaminase-like cysteine peptidase n=1 Tax=Ferirhizobium litorale TaxID=2927786 RepID=A0AAE3QFK9_9HYPH|nr:transglutaminase-like cysteine peptidase [Fererhizobium litorale]MDI7864537.1 transglutaminase-like cysteine peptidase [Fererhizobium litorale]MDI7924922.1 transglutaminase-like cysteine peptidase [Fererhizobium litorale]
MSFARARGVLVAMIAVLSSATIAVPAPRPHAGMITGSVTSQPIGHYEFCQSHRDECSVRSRSTTAVRLTEFGWATVRAINASVNHSIAPMTDQDLYGRDEVWAYPADAGDCEDFVLLKRKKLMDQGFSASDLLITVVRKPDGEGHAVLTVRTSEGDYVLDNLEDEVKVWYETPYTYLKRQATFNSGRWVTIENSGDLMVGAVAK